MVLQTKEDKLLATVSARVPVEVRNQVHQRLRREGSTPSEFINEVYAKFLDGELSFQSEKVQTLEKSANDEIINVIKLSTCNFENPLPSSFDFKAELEKGRASDYEAIA